MKKLSKEQLAERTAHVANLSEAWEVIEMKIGTIDGQIAELNTLIEKYNADLSEAETWKEGITGQMDDFISERSERWTESDAGQSYEAWKSEWEQFDATSLEPVENIDLETPEHADDLEALPEAPE